MLLNLYIMCVAINILNKGNASQTIGPACKRLSTKLKNIITTNSDLKSIVARLNKNYLTNTVAAAVFA